MDHLPVIDVAPLVSAAGVDGTELDDSGLDATASAIDQACRDVGFFYISGHGVDPELRRSLDAAARRFFALPEAAKARIAMTEGGRAWRGWFPFEGELTSGRADRKEGVG